MRNRTARRARPTNLSNKGIGTLPWSYLVVIAICGCVIAAGFLLAARQHFVSMDLGMKNSKLRKQLEDLETENRRLTLAREVASSPIEMTKTARNFGFVEAGESPLVVQASVTPQKKTDAPMLIKAVALETRGSEVLPSGVTRTAYQRPASLASKVEITKKPAAEKPMPEKKAKAESKSGEKTKAKSAKPDSKKATTKR